jgi:hypothetical protein
MLKIACSWKARIADFGRQSSNLNYIFCKSEVNVMIFKIFSTKILAKQLAFLLKLDKNFHGIIFSTLIGKNSKNNDPNIDPLCHFQVQSTQGVSLPNSNRRYSFLFLVAVCIFCRFICSQLMAALSLVQTLWRTRYGRMYVHV